VIKGAFSAASQVSKKSRPTAMTQGLIFGERIFVKDSL